MTEVRYSIKDLENFTDIKAHTIRIWEQRYKLLAPKRTETNIRYYSENDLKKILNINLLYNHGFKISKIAAMTEAQIVLKSTELINEVGSTYQAEIDEFIVAILAFDQRTIRALLERESSKMAFVSLYERIIVPLLHKIGELWQVNTFEIIHEHFFSSLYRDFLFRKIHALPEVDNESEAAVLFLHDEEEHEFSLLLFHYLLKENGYNCIYLGQNLPVRDLHVAINQVKPKLLVTSFITPISEKKFKLVVDCMTDFSNNVKLLVSGRQAVLYKKHLGKKIDLIKSVEDLKKYWN